MTTPRRSAGWDHHLTARFALTFRDYWDFNKYALVRTPWLPHYAGGLTALALAILITDAARQSDPVLAFVRNFLVSAAVVGFIGVAVYFRYRGHARKTFAQNPHLAGVTTVTLDEHGVHVEAEAGRLDVEWGMFKRIEQTQDCIYLLYGQSLATIVPKRTFRNEAEAQAFFRFARESWGRAAAKRASSD